jgi:hypothetical protein
MGSKKENRIEGVVGYFSDSHALVEAMKKVRSENFESIDAFTPFPVHGLDAAQGLDRSPLPYITFGAGLTGFLCGFLLQYWTSAVSWPLNVGGKPLNSWPAFVPVFFEVTVLFAGICTVLGLILICRLPNISKKIPSARLTNDRFAIVIESPEYDEDEDPNPKYKKFDEKTAQEVLKKAGATDVQTYMAEGWF